MPTLLLHLLATTFLRPESLGRGRAELSVRTRDLAAIARLPDEFDARDAWPHCPSIADIWDQSACGDCWAVATVTAATDRLCIAAGAASAMSLQPRLSVEHMVGCCRTCGYGCGDGFPNYAWQWLAGDKGSPYGLVTGGPFGDTRWCSAYTLPPCSHYNNPPDSPLPSCEGGPPKPTPACPKACDANSSYTTPFEDDIHRFQTAYALPDDEAQIRAEIFEHGPVTAGFNVYQDWTRYTSGVYKAASGQMLGAHAVRIIGWGVEDGEKYWLVANSFGAKWGDRGTFKIARGRGECGIEEAVVAGLPHGGREDAKKKQSQKSTRAPPTSSPTLAGRLTLEGPPGTGNLLVRAVRNPLVDGAVQPLTKPQLYAALADPRLPTAVARADGTFAIDHGLLSNESYSIVGWEDADGDGRWDPDDFERCGWWSGDAPDDGHLPKPVNAAAAASGGGDALLRFALKLAVPLPPPSAAPNGFGVLRYVRGQASLRVWGGAAQRGEAHGQLLGANIVCFFRHFTLEETTDSVRQYEERVLPFIRSAYNYSAAYLEEARAVVRGMCDSGAALHIPELNRDFGLDDLLYLNDYGAYPENQHAGAPARRGCTQFAFWGNATRGSDARGGTIVGRNSLRQPHSNGLRRAAPTPPSALGVTLGSLACAPLAVDGENDLRRTTVTNLLLHAVDPSAERERAGGPPYRFVHAFWPGFIGSASGLSERGMHVMMNDGQGHPEATDPAVGLTPNTWLQRQVLTHVDTLDAVPPVIAAHAGSRGGSCGSDCVLMFAVPSGGAHGAKGDADAAMVYEGDRLGGVFRRPGDFPHPSMGIMASNHFKVYGYDPLRPLDNFGYQVYFSSLWRYEAGQNMVQAWADTLHPVGTAEVVRLLQAVSHGTTEHAIIMRPDAREIDVAVASAAAGGWHAPYLRWQTFRFDEFFA